MLGGCAICKQPFNIRWRNQRACGKKCGLELARRVRSGLADKKMTARCPICQLWFRKKRTDQKTCGKSLCRRANGARKWSTAKVRKAKLRAETLVSDMFPNLSVREVKLFNFAHRLGYKQGYQRARWKGHHDPRNVI